MRQLGWDGVVFEVPDNWELARYHYAFSGVVRLVIEDEYAVRMEAEWLEARKEGHAQRFTEHATQSLAALIKKADSQVVLDGLPSAWRAVHCHFSEIIPVRRRDRTLGVVAHDLVTAIYAPRDTFRCVIRLHFMPGDKEPPVELARRVLTSFAWNATPGEKKLWQVFDLSYRIDASFRLESTTFGIGSKLLVFRRDGRRLYLWTLSCADRLPVNEPGGSEWVIGYLNGLRRVTGIVFRPDGAGGIGWKRRGLLALVHRDELARWCFRYTVDYRVLEERNQLMIRVFNYRHEADLDWLASASFGPAAE